MFGRKTQEGPVKRHSDNSSNSLVNNSQHSHTNIPMEQFSVTPIPAHNNNNSSNFNAKEEIEHDPLPPAVDYTGVSPSAKYQFRALGRRALSYHRRQRVTNVCCLVLWPIVLVLICFAISVTSGGDSKKTYTLAFCSNEADPATSTPVSNLDKVKAELISKDNKFHAAWYPSEFFGQSRNQLPCVRWFGNTYPNKAPYENVTAADRAMPDAYYIPPPAGGWFNLEEIRKKWYEAETESTSNTRFLRASPAIFYRDDINQTVFYAAANADVVRALGLPANVTETFTSAVWPPVDPKIVFKGPQNATAANGLLGAIPVRYAYNVQYDRDSSDSKSSNKYSAQKFIAVQDGASLDTKVREVVFKWADGLGGYRNDPLKPFGGVYFEALDMNKQAIQMTMQYGVPPQSEWSNYDDLGSGIRQMVTMTQMTSALVKIKYAGKYVITQGLRALPYEFDPNWLNGYMLNEISMYLFPFGLSFLLPTFVALLVQEKEDRHRAMMAMNGLKSSAYYLAHYLEFMVMQLVLSLFFCLACVAISSQLVLRTNPGILIVVLILWAHAQATFSFLIASLFSRTRKATLIVYFFVAVSAIMGSVTNQIFKDGVPLAWFIHPSFAFFNILFSGIRHSSRVNGLNPLVWGDLAPGTTLFACLMILLGEGILFVILALYIDAVVPSEYGVQKPWHFPISDFFKKSKSKRDPESKLRASSHATENDLLEGADADVYAERERVQTVYDPEKTPLIIDNLFHRYRGKIDPALRGMSFGVETNTVLGLLGPNGAGKSTLIHLLTGLYKPTSGTAHVAGADIRTNMAMVHAKIGVCPQHDILWGDLTVADHLLFYSRLRGIPPHLEQQAVTYAIASVSLTKFRDRQVKGLSGGEKRRVSIAIALLGDNSVIFLDEPSTGLDPAVRRVIWDIINRVKVNRTVVLTTHSMEEADILSDKIAIMTLGRLRCIGTSLHLKELYGSGFRLDVSSKPGRLADACASIEQGLMRGMKYRRLDKFTNATTFEFEVSKSGDLSRIFGALSQPGLYADVEDWGISQTTLEDVFIKIVTEGDSALAMPSIVQQ
ncbi:hypothetical protein BGZ74_009883 [Mortierella antarctica]|nr:hypothetical protein BGZ74_009883 [Mortierella antarctica]